MSDNTRQTGETPDENDQRTLPLARRDFVKGGLAAGVLAGTGLLSGSAAAATGPAEVRNSLPAPDFPNGAGYGLDVYLDWGANPIQGDVDVAPREGYTLVVNYEWLAGALPKGQQSDPTAGSFLLEKPLDSSTPDLYRTMAEGTTLFDVTLEFSGIADTGEEFLYATYTLKNPGVRSIEMTRASNYATYTEVVALTPSSVEIDVVGAGSYAYAL